MFSVHLLCLSNEFWVLYLWFFLTVIKLSLCTTKYQWHVSRQGQNIGMKTLRAHTIFLGKTNDSDANCARQCLPFRTCHKWLTTFRCIRVSFSFIYIHLSFISIIFFHKNIFYNHFSCYSINECYLWKLIRSSNQYWRCLININFRDC